MNARKWNRLEEFCLGQLDLADSTTDKTLRTLRFMERHRFPLERPTAKAYNAFVARRKREGARPEAIRHARKAVRRLFLFHGREPPFLRSVRAPRPRVHVMPDDQVVQLMQYPRFPDMRDRELEVVRFCFEFGFYMALRCPSEHVALRVGDFDDATGELRIYAPKTHRYDVLQLEPWLAELVRAYISGPRDAIAVRSERALLVNPNPRSWKQGEAWTTENYRVWLTRHGKRVFPTFCVKRMRSWGGTWRAIQWQLNVLLTKSWLRHAEISNTMRYIEVASETIQRRAVEHNVQPLIVA